MLWVPKRARSFSMGHPTVYNITSYSVVLHQHSLAPYLRVGEDVLAGLQEGKSKSPESAIGVQDLLLQQQELPVVENRIRVEKMIPQVDRIVAQASIVHIWSPERGKGEQGRIHGTRCA